MRCRIAEDSQVVEPISWQSADGSRRDPVRRADPASSGGSADIAQLRQQLGESERRRQLEVAQARQEAFAEGARQAREEAAAEVRAVMERVAATLTDLAGTKKRVRHEAEAELLKLSIAIARRVIHRELALDPEALTGVIHAALQKLQNRDVSRVRVFPGGADSVRGALERYGAPPGLEVVPDPSMRSGDVVFETTMGQLDASVDTQLQEIQRGLTDRLAIR